MSRTLLIIKSANTTFKVNSAPHDSYASQKSQLLVLALQKSIQATNGSYIFGTKTQHNHKYNTRTSHPGYRLPPYDTGARTQRKTKQRKAKLHELTNRR